MSRLSPELPGRAGRDPIPATAGIGLRLPHHAAALAGPAAATWFEVHPENYLDNPAALGELEAVRAAHRISLHSVGMSLGSAEGVDRRHLQRLRALADRLQPGLMSDHLSWSVTGGQYLPDLLPLPYTAESLAVMCRNVDLAQSILGRQLLIENPSTYLSYAHTDCSEPQFLAQLVGRTGCGVLLDINNIHVSATNQQLDPVAALDDFLECLPSGAVGELHLAGHATVMLESGRQLLIDDHGSAVSAPVWALYQRALARLGPAPTLVEWDTRLPEFAVLQREAARAQRALEQCSIAQPELRHASAC